MAYNFDGVRIEIKNNEGGYEENKERIATNVRQKM